MVEGIYYDISIAKLKQLVDKSNYKEVRFAITEDNKLIGADAQYFTHASMDPALSARAIGYINKKNGEYVYTAWKNHSWQRVDVAFHPMLARFEAWGIIPPLTKKRVRTSVPDGQQP